MSNNTRASKPPSQLIGGTVKQESVERYAEARTERDAATRELQTAALVALLPFRGTFGHRPQNDPLPENVLSFFQSRRARLPRLTGGPRD